MEEETTMMIPPQGMDEDMGEGIASLPEQGDSGIADLPQAAQQLAQLGRAQDTFLGHLAQDEIVIPLSLLQASPELEDVIRNAFEAEGMDYSQYVVGSDENSINPETGLPEFGWLKDRLEDIKDTGKKLEREVKKAGKKIEKEVIRKPIKKVARELKKAAPVVLPVALTLLAGPQASLFQQMLLSGGGSGISTLLAGGDFKAALTGAISGTQNYLKTGSPLDSGNLAGPEFAGEPVQYVGDGNTRGFNLGADAGPNLASDATTNLASDATTNLASDATTKLASNVNTTPYPPTGGYGTTVKDVAAKPSTFTQKVKDAYTAAKDKTADLLFRAGDTKAEVEAAKKVAGDNYIQKRLAQGIVPTEQGLMAAEAAAGPSALARFGPTAALGVGALYASEAFKKSEEVRAARQKFADDLAYADTIPQMGAPANIGYITGAQTLAGAPDYSYSNPLYQGGYFLNNPIMNNPMMNNPTLNTGITMAKGGGEMAVTNLDVSKFPRRTGRISGPGTETSDSIPAMLSDGEFVMNARAVRGAGNGSREAGVRKMYDMMRNFESKVA